MGEKTKNVLLSVLVVGLVSMTVAYAALSQTLNINGSATVQNVASSWKVRFKSLTSGTAITPSGYASVTGNVTSISIPEDSTSVTLPAATLKAPGDKVVYKWLVANDGDINAKITTAPILALGEPTCDGGCVGEGKVFATETDKTNFLSKINVSLVYDDTDTAPAVDDALNAGATRTLKATIELDSSATTLPASDVSFTGINAHMIYGQN